MTFVSAIVVAGGTGERLGVRGGKQLITVMGRPVLSWSIDAMVQTGRLGRLVVVCPPGRCDEYQAVAMEPLAVSIPVMFVEGGETRQESVSNGLTAAVEGADLVLVHDGARPLVASEDVVRAIDLLTSRPDAAGVVLGHPSIDSLKVAEGDRIEGTVDRSRVWAVQTPQVFRALALVRAYRQAAGACFEGTDDASLVERSGGTVLLCEGSRDNIKITVPEDVAIAEAVLSSRLDGGVHHEGRLGV